VVVEFDSRRSYGRAGVVREEHHTVETVDCHDAGRMVYQQDVEEPRVKGPTRSPQPWEAGYRGRCQR
jgi:hypothetical protein